ncbi:MAG: cytochrome c peroxidase [Cyclobacteriaceae bacterium]|jgi:cytochrome c peroxidase
MTYSVLIMHISSIQFILFLGLFFLWSCNDSQEPEEVVIENDFGFVKPEHFPEPSYTFSNNEVTKEGFNLGKALFFDPIFSRDGTVACSSCHDQTVAFADPQHRLSIGIEDRVGVRNAPQMTNLAFMNNFFWDGGVIHVDFIPLNAIENPLEMDEETSEVVVKLRNTETYPPMFAKAFGTDSVSTPRMLHALSQFMVMLVSADAPYDQYRLNKAELTNLQVQGLDIFEEKCASCHSGELFTDQSFRNNGLDSEFEDLGRGVITEDENDFGKFRVPSLRNVMLTKPYMHDGRFSSIEEVLAHYNEGVVFSESLDETLKGERLGIALTEDERLKIAAFLETLTDTNFISNPTFFK